MDATNLGHLTKMERFILDHARDEQSTAGFPNFWPDNSVMLVETIAALRERVAGLEQAMRVANRTFQDIFVSDDHEQACDLAAGGGEQASAALAAAPRTEAK